MSNVKRKVGIFQGMSFIPGYAMFAEVSEVIYRSAILRKVDDREMHKTRRQADIHGVHESSFASRERIRAMRRTH